MPKKNAAQEIKEIVTWVKTRKNIRRNVLYTVMSLLAFWFLAGFFMPFSFQREACARQILNGEAPSSLWSWHPAVALNSLSGRDALLEGSQRALSLGADSGAIEPWLPRLAWASAISPHDGKIQARCAMAFTLNYALGHLENDVSEASGLASLLGRAKGGPYGDEMVLAAAASGLMSPLERVRALEAIRERRSRPTAVQFIRAHPWVILEGLALHMIGMNNEAKWIIRKSVIPEDPSLDPLLQQQDAFSRFLFRPNLYAHRVEAMLQNPGRPDYERIRLAELAIVNAWIDGADGGKKILDAPAVKDPWISAFESRLEGANWLAGLNGQEFVPIWTRCVDLVTPWTTQPLLADQAVYALEKPAAVSGPDIEGLVGRDPIFEGTYYSNDQTHETIKRVEVENLIAKLKTQGKTLIPLPAIPPLVDKTGRGSALGATVSYLAAQMACEVPEPVFSAPYGWDWFTSLGGFEPSTYWDSARKHWLQLRLDTPSRLDGSLVKRGHGWRVTVHLVKDGHASANLSTYFSIHTLNQAPRWLAVAAYKLSGKKLSPANAAAMKVPWVANGRDLIEMADTLTGLNLDVNRAKRYRQLYADDRSPALLRFADFLTTQDGVSRTALLAETAQAEPWRVYTQDEVASEDMQNCLYVAALREYLNLLHGDLGNPRYLSQVDLCLEYCGFGGESDEVDQICLDASGQGSNQLLQAINQVWDERYWERGEGWANTVGPWGWDCVAYCNKLAKKYAEAGLSRTPQDVRFTTELIRLQLDGGDETTCARYFMNGHLQEPCYSPLYTDRLNFLKPRWDGTNERMLAFARRWKDEVPELLIEAHEDLASNYKNVGGVENTGSQKDFTDYFSGPNTWSEARESYWIPIRKNPDDWNAWKALFNEAPWVGHVEDELASMRTFVVAHPSLAPYKDYLTITAFDQIAAGKSDMQTQRGENPSSIPEKDGSKYLSQDSVWRDYESAYRSFILAHPGNDLRPNWFAQTSWQLGKKDSARWAFRHLKQWEEEAWSRDDFEKARQWADQP